MTWHQEQAAHRAFKAGTPLRYWHETLWAVVSNPPNDMCSIMDWPTESQAREYAKGFEHTLVLPPGPGGRK